MQILDISRANPYIRLGFINGLEGLTEELLVADESQGHIRK
jgi:hypothetical protein